MIAVSLAVHACQGIAIGTELHGILGSSKTFRHVLAIMTTCMQKRLSSDSRAWKHYLLRYSSTAYSTKDPLVY